MSGAPHAGSCSSCDEGEGVVLHGMLGVEVQLFIQQELIVDIM